MDYSKFPHQRGVPPSSTGERQARHLDTLGAPSLHRKNPDGSVSRKVNGALYVDPAKPEAQAGVAGYEFFVADDYRELAGEFGSVTDIGVPPEDDEGLALPGFPLSNFTQGHAVYLNQQGRAVARYSTNLTPNTTLGQGWPLVSARRLTSVTNSSGTRAEPGYFYTKWAWNNAKLFQHSWWKQNKGDWLLTSTIGTNYGLATNAPQSGPGSTASSYAQFLYLLKMGDAHMNDPLALDAGFDVLTASHSKAGVKVGGSRQQGSKVWYRRAAVQTVTLPSGMRRDYVIHSDTHGRFTVWPLDEYQNSGKFAELYAENPIAYADLPPKVAKVFLPPYPSWVTVPDTDQDVTFQHWTWQFNKSGTKCVTVAHKKIESWVWVWTKDKPVDLFGPYHLVDGKPFMPDAHYNNHYSSLNAGSGYTNSAPGREADGTFRPDPNDATWQYMRVREYRRKFVVSPQQAYPIAYMVNGQLLACSRITGRNPILDGNTRDWKPIPEESVDGFEPAFTYLPGIVELGIKVTAINERDPYDFTVSFEVLRDEFYDDTTEYRKRYFVDAAYYVATPRTKSQDEADGLKDDDLLTAEVEVFFTPGQGVTDATPDPTDKTTGRVWKALTIGAQHAQGGRYLEGVVGPPGQMSGRRYHDHIDEPYLESVLTGQFRAEGVYAYYTVRNKDTEAMVQRLCLVHNERWEAFNGGGALQEFFFAGPDGDRDFEQANGIRVGYWGRIFMPRSTASTGNDAFETGLANAKYVSENHMPATFETHIDVADLRFLNFVTRTYQRDRAQPSSYQRVLVTDPITEVSYTAWNATRATYRFINQQLPNHHLRIRGEAVRAILYQPDIPEFGPDPAATKIFPPNAVRLPSIPRGEAPCGNEGATLAMQQEFAARFITPALLPGANIPAHPDGHWSACINRTQGEVFYDETESGEEDLTPTYTGNLMAPLSGSTEGALGWFDRIHVHGRQDTTHKAVFNAAFGQARDYSYWADPDGAGGNFKPEEALGNAGDDEQYGGFMAGALWVKT